MRPRLPDGPAVRRFLDAAETIGDLNVHATYHAWRLRCPAHRGDNASSLSIAQGDRGVIVNCFRGCETGEVARALGLRMTELFDDYTERLEPGRPPRLRMRVRPGDKPPIEAEWVNAFAAVARRIAALDEAGRYEDE